MEHEELEPKITSEFTIFKIIYVTYIYPTDIEPQFSDLGLKFTFTLLIIYTPGCIKVII